MSDRPSQLSDFEEVPFSERMPGKQSTRPPAGMQYLYSYRFLFDHPSWGMTLLACSVCRLVPVVGPLVALGYQEDVIESLHRGDGEKYPAFDMNRLGYYLQRSLWPFLVALVLMFVLQPVFMVLIYGSMFAIGGLAAAAGDAAPVVLGIAIPTAILLALALSFAMQMVILPITLRAGLSQDFGQAFRLGWTFDFIRRVWVEELLTLMFLTMTGAIFFAVGMALFCLGVYPAMAIVYMAWAHLQYQLYELYLARGGEPIPMKPPPVRVKPEYAAQVQPQPY